MNHQVSIPFAIANESLLEKTNRHMALLPHVEQWLFRNAGYDRQAWNYRSKDGCLVVEFEHHRAAVMFKMTFT